MLQTPHAFFEKIREKTVVFVGIGVTNTETIKLFARQGIRTIACDQRTEEEMDAGLLNELRDLRVRLQLGEGYLNFGDFDILMRTPGLYYYTPELTEMRRQGHIITSELELFFSLCPCPIIAVTGSDGKSTTSTLIAEILKKQGHTVHLGGNIGVALLPQIFDIQRRDIAVVELSSFQLLSMRSSPEVSLITNISENHLDVHQDMEEYIDAKRNIYLHQDAFSRTTLNKDNDITNAFAPEVRGRLSRFSLKSPVYNGAYLREDGVLVSVHFGKETPLFHKDDIRIPGEHNVANYLAAISGVGPLASPEAIESVARNFAGVEHRIEFVREKDGVRWFNDGIATSPTRVVAGLRSFEGNIILIAGGYDKQLDYTPMLPDLLKRVKLLITVGPAAPRLEEAVRGAEHFVDSGLEIVRAQSLADAVKIADQHGVAGDVVTLSPANASFDAYPNFEARGKHFKELVRSL